MGNQGLAVSIISRWGTECFDAISGVIVSSRIVVKVDNAICWKCARQLMAGDSVALVRFVGNVDSDYAYHLDCLPADYTPIPETR